MEQLKKLINSPFNIIKEKDLSLLNIDIYMVQKLNKDEIKKLRKIARKFLNDKI